MIPVLWYTFLINIIDFPKYDLLGSSNAMTEIYEKRDLLFIKESLLFIKENLLFIKDNWLFIKDNLLFIKENLLLVKENLLFNQCTKTFLGYTPIDSSSKHLLSIGSARLFE